MLAPASAALSASDELAAATGSRSRRGTRGLAGGGGGATGGATATVGGGSVASLSLASVIVRTDIGATLGSALPGVEVPKRSRKVA